MHFGPPGALYTIMAQAHKTKVGRYVVVDSGVLSTDHMVDGTPILSAEMVSELERRATITVLRDVELVSGEELRFARKVLGLRQSELAEQLGVAVETVSRWEPGADAFKRPIQLAVCDLLATVQQTGRLPQKRNVSGFELRVA
jgi:DNA-binding transcriptional regulator YiaG